LKSNYSKNFEKQISLLNKHFNFLYPNEFFEEEFTQNNINILITFDDGYKDNCSIAYPILKKHNAKAIFFIPTSLIGTNKWLWHDKVYYLISTGVIDFNKATRTLNKMNKQHKVPNSFIKLIDEKFEYKNDTSIMMNWGNVNELFKHGFQIGSHTCNHRILPFLDYEQQETEIKSSMETINKKLKTKCKLLSYPNSLYDKNTLEIVSQLNIGYGFTSRKGINFKYSDRKLLNRIGLKASDSIYVLLFKIFIYSLKR
jgi:peptidoglycan/xylan/chitin deacetylase (PgdA/CDA1 family)